MKFNYKGYQVTLNAYQSPDFQGNKLQIYIFDTYASDTPLINEKQYSTEEEALEDGEILVKQKINAM